MHFLSDLRPHLKQICCLCCVEWICTVVWVERPFVFGNLANASDQLVWNQEAFNLTSRGAFLIGMCDHWTSSKDFKFFCVVVKNASNDKSNKTQIGKKSDVYEDQQIGSTFPFHIYIYTLSSAIWVVKLPSLAEGAPQGFSFCSYLPWEGFKG